MNYLGTDFVSTVPADNTAAKLGALWLRDIKTRLKAWATVLFDLETGLLKSAVVTSANLAAPSGAAAAHPVSAIGANAYTHCEFNAQGQLVKGLRGGLVAADYADASVTTAKLAALAVTQLILADAEVTAEKFHRPRKWVRYDTDARALLATGTRSGTTATVKNTAHGILVGDLVTISGTTPAAYSGTFTVTATSADEFSYTMASDPGGSTTVHGSVVVLIKAGSFTLTGSQVTVTLSGNGTTVTATTGSAHGYATGDRVRISGSTAVGFNGERIITVQTTTVFVYSAAGTTPTGTTKAQKLARDCSVVRTATGTATITFATAFPDLNYAVTGAPIDRGYGRPHTTAYESLAVGSVTLLIRARDGVLVDDEVSVVFTS